MKHLIGAVFIVLAISGCCTGAYPTRRTSAPPDFILSYPARVSLHNQASAKVRIPLTFTNSAERTICLGKPSGKGGWRCGYKPELRIRQPATGPDFLVSVQLNGLLGERVKRGRDAKTEGLAYAELTLRTQSLAEATSDVCIELLLRDDKGVATVMSRAGGPVQVSVGSNLSAPIVHQPSEMSDKPIDCGFGATEAAK